MRYLNLWQTELPPIIDVSVGPINGAAMLAERHKPCVIGQSADKADDATIAGSNPAAAPPEPTMSFEDLTLDLIAAHAEMYGLPGEEPTPADSERVISRQTLSQEVPGTEREGDAWVPWSGGECYTFWDELSAALAKGE